ncbi:hypothetical protein PIROE2DRAFT_16768 [Piromyces sp. E2]|nr:hypothetical protein PIROE2DRAFT_16768 [Piromyces sp. E2]|eukprot:OUM58057.1 hypothetical protein PIROE2DRAFT_16768 [Piromyces sp. E2]
MLPFEYFPSLQLPTCTTPSTGEENISLCKTSENADITNGNYCIDSNNKIYKSTETPPQETGVDATYSCDPVSIATDTADYYIYKCTGGACTTDDLSSIISAEAVAIYKKQLDDTVQQITTGNIFTGGKLLLCEATGECKLPTNTGYYIPDDTTKTTYPLIKVGDDTPTFTPISTSSITAHSYYGDATTKSTTGDVTSYTQIIHCSTNSSCTASEDLSAGILVNSGGTGNAILNCSTTSCTEETADANTYYMNAGGDKDDTTTPKPLIICSSSNCQTNAGVVGYYIDSGKITASSNPVTYDNVIVCGSGDNGAITCESKIASVIGAGYFPDGSKKVATDTNGKTYTQLIECESATCKSSTVNNGIYVNKGVDANALTDAVFNCSGNSCVMEAAVDGNYYMNAGSDKNDTTTPKPLIICSENTGCQTSALAAGYYIDSGSKNGNAYNKVIVCTTGESAACNSKTASEIGAGYYPDDSKKDASDDTGKTYTQIIECGSATCSSNAPPDGIYVNKGVDANALTDAVFNCNGNSCVMETPVDGNYYMNAGSDKDDNTNAKPLIICSDSTRCQTSALVAGYYIDSGSKNGNAYDKVIVCTTGDLAACESKTASEIGAGYYPDDGKKDGEAYTQLIECGSTCKSSAASDGVYVNKGVASGNAIFNCSSGSCSLATPTDGTYYINAGSDNTGDGKTIIKCTEEEGCVKDDAIGFYVSEEGKETTTEGKITYANIIHCTTESEALKCKNAENPSGFYINEGSKETGDPVKYSKIIHCTSDGTGAATTCTSDETVTAGYYLDASDATKKTLIECSGIPVKCQSTEVTEAGYYINGNDDATNHLTDDIIYCSKANADTDVLCGEIDGTENGYYRNSGSDKGENPLINCIAATGCSTVTALEGYYIHEPSKITDSEPVTYGQLLLCGKESSNPITCSVAEDIPTSDYIIDSGTLKQAANDTTPATFTQLIQCTIVAAVEEGADPTTTCSSTSPTADGYYIDGSASTNIIECTGGDTDRVCTTTAHQASEETGPKHFVGHDGKVITCTTGDASKCLTVETVLKGYYINSGSDHTTKPIITCDGGECETAAYASSCAPGKVITGNQLCITSTNQEEIAVNTETNATPTYETITLATANDFPGASTGKNAVKLRTDGSAVLLERTSLPTCKADPESTFAKCKNVSEKVVSHCILGDIIYESDASNEKCAKLTKTNNGTKAYLFKDDGSTPEATETATMAYQCTFGSDGLEKCILVQGYVTIDTTVYQCNGWKGEECKTVTVSACEAYAHGKLGKISEANSICFTVSVGFNLPADTATTPSLLSFTLPITSSEYGVMAGEIVTLSLTSTEAIVTTFDEEYKNNDRIEYKNNIIEWNIKINNRIHKTVTSQ